jgi:hypothetical protein
MKRLSIAVITVALIAMMSTAVMAEGMMFGVKGGLNLANVSGLDEWVGVEGDMAVKFGGGVFLNYAVTEAFSIQPELLYMMAGSKFNFFIDVNFNLAYFEIPLLAKYSIPMEGAFSPNFFAGPYVGFLMSSKLEASGEEEDMKDYTKSTDFGLMFGAGFDYAVGSGAITFDVRYSLGLTSISDVPEDELGGEDQPDLKNSGILFMVGYGFMF